MIGDPVNLASRIEGATKEYHVDLLIGDELARLVREAFVIRSVDLVRVKGRVRPVEVFTVLAERNGDSRDPEWLGVYENGVRLYRSREFAAAAQCFSEVAALQPGDRLAQDYLRRAESYAASPPAPDWDGVYIMTQK